MAIGGVKNEVCKFKAISIAKKYGFTPKNSTSGKNIGTNIINISVELYTYMQENLQLDMLIHMVHKLEFS